MMINHDFGLVQIDKEFECEIKRLAAFYAQKASQLNFTAAKSESEITARHLTDAFIAYKALKLYNLNIPVPLIADAGAGGGFIGLALKVFMPNTKTAEIESVQRKCALMNWLVLKMGFSGVTVLNTRVETLKDFNADVVIERAMGQLKDIAKPCIGLLKSKGLFLAYQGGEVSDAEVFGALNGLNAFAKGKISYKLNDGLLRFLYIIEKS